MSTKKHIETASFVVANKRVVPRNARNLEVTSWQAHRTEILPELRLNYRAVEPRYVQELQRMAGNRAVSLLLPQSAQRIHSVRLSSITGNQSPTSDVGRQDPQAIKPAAVQRHAMKEAKSTQDMFVLRAASARSASRPQLMDSRPATEESAVRRSPLLQRRVKAKGKPATGKRAVDGPTPQRNAAKADALTNIAQLERQVSINMRKWQTAARKVGSGYELAGNRHTNACSEAAKQKALQQAILLGVLTAATAGGLAWLSGIVQTANESRRQLVNILEDAVQSGVGEAIDVTQTAIAPSTKTVSGNYLSYQNDLLNNLDDLMNNVTQYFIEVVKAIQAQPWNTWDQFDSRIQKARHEAWLKKSKLSNAPEVPPNDKIADSLETDMWAKWIPGLIGERMRVGGCSGIVYKDLDVTSPGLPVEKALNRLGITSSAGIGEDFGWWTSDAEIIKLRAWALRHRPKKLLDL